MAKLAGVPKDVVKRAQQILKILENDGIAGLVGEAQMLVDAGVDELGEQPQLFTLSTQEKLILDQLRSINLNEMTPLEALQKLAELQKEVMNKII